LCLSIGRPCHSAISQRCPEWGNNTTESNAGVGPNRALPYYLGPLIIHSVDYSNMIIGQQLVVPDSSVIGPGYKLAGVLVNSIPHAVTNDVGITTNDWMVTFILSDKIILNGTTTFGDLSGHFVVITESYVGRLNAHDAAVDLMKPGLICTGTPQNRTQSCTLAPNANPGQLVEVRGAWLVVHPEVPAATIYVGDPVNRAYTISGDFNAGNLTHQQLLSLASSVIP